MGLIKESDLEFFSQELFFINQSAQFININVIPFLQKDRYLTKKFLEKELSMSMSLLTESQDREYWDAWKKFSHREISSLMDIWQYYNHLLRLSNILEIEPEQKYKKPEKECILYLRERGKASELSLLRTGLQESKISGMIMEKPEIMTPSEFTYNIYFGFVYRKSTDIGLIKKIMLKNKQSTQFYLGLDVESIRRLNTRKAINYAMFLHSKYSEDFNLTGLDDIIEKEIF